MLNNLTNPQHPLHNPEAGNHPLPHDSMEIEAALRCGRRILNLYPYFNERYGQRGEAFTRSDTGYLVTLLDHDQHSVDHEVGWLAQVLAARGMPRFLTEVHLDVLAEELVTLVPEQVERYRKLTLAAETLREERLLYLSQANFDGLSAAFEENSSGTIPNVGPILVGAVCDEAAGLKEVVPRLVSWIDDGQRFSATWRQAVADTLKRARAMMEQNKGHT
jgi:hypothetical protein